MNRAIWIESISAHYCPAWPCPACRKGTIVLIPKSLVSEETAESKKDRSHEAWDPEWIRLVFTAWAECSHPSCRQRYAISGAGTVEPDYGEDGEMVLEKAYCPKCCIPMPDIFEFPKKCPDNVMDELRAAFATFWSHPKSCAARIRVSLECLLDHLGVQKRKKNSQGKFYELTLHKRIDEFAKRDPDSGVQLMALKWLGNSGSHDAVVAPSDLLDAFEIMEHALSEVIDRRSRRVMQLAKGLTKKHRS